GRRGGATMLIGIELKNRLVTRKQTAHEPAGQPAVRLAQLGGVPRPERRDRLLAGLAGDQPCGIRLKRTDGAAQQRNVLTVPVRFPCEELLSASVSVLDLPWVHFLL